VNNRLKSQIALGLLVFGTLLAGCSSKPAAAPAESGATAPAASNSAASYNQPSGSGQRYQQAIQQSGGKSPYSR
jgi:hypothetical protein